jgi:hypothetical protein
VFHGLSGLAIVGAMVSLPAFAHAQGASPAKPRAKKRSDPAAPPVDVKPIVAKLKSDDDAVVKSGLDDARLSGTGAAAAAPHVAGLLLRGVTLPLTQSAIETLADLGSEAGSRVLALYASHRNVAVRRAAVKALLRTKGAPANDALRRALSDSDALIRGVAATGLGSLRATAAVPDLFVSLDHRVNEAAVSLGQLCAGEQCLALVGKLGQLPFDVVTGGLDQVLFRPATEVNDDTKVKVIGRIREQGTIEGNKFLRDIQKRATTAGFSPRLQQAIEQAVLATAGGAG